MTKESDISNLNDKRDVYELQNESGQFVYRIWYGSNDGVIRKQITQSLDITGRFLTTSSIFEVAKIEYNVGLEGSSFEPSQYIKNNAADVTQKAIDKRQ